MIPPVGAVNFHVAGLENLEDELVKRIMRRAPQSITFEVVAGGSRGARENSRIAREQISAGRNPWFINRSARRALISAATGLASLSRGQRAAAENEIKEIILQSIGENVEAQKNPDRTRFKKLTKDYAAMKRRKFGSETPILKASGDLLGGISIKVRRKNTV